MSKAGIDDINAGALSEASIASREQPEDLVGAAVFLASPETDFMTGQVIYIDGGTVML